jgi:hypothetical protein
LAEFPPKEFAFMNNPRGSAASAPLNTSPRSLTPSYLRVRVGLVTTLLGLIIFIAGTKPEVFHLDRSPTVGFVQISVFLIGLAIICLGGYISLWGLWKGMERSIPADIGLRMVSTGYVIAVFSGMADVFGMGSQPPPQVPFFGPLQALGVLIGEIVIALGFLLLVPLRISSTKQRPGS